MVGLRERAHHIAFTDGARASAGDEPGRTVSTTLAEILRREMAVNLFETVVSGCKGDENLHALSVELVAAG
jgi:hypothetical protein